MILISIRPFDKDCKNASYVSETVVGAKEVVMTDSGFSRISVAHGRLKCSPV